MSVLVLATHTQMMCSQNELCLMLPEWLADDVRIRILPDERLTKKSNGVWATDRLGVPPTDVMKVHCAYEHGY